MDVGIREIAEQINLLAKQRPIGKLQEIRREIKGKRPRCRTIFSTKSIFETYAFHLGGRTELQFNIAFEDDAKQVFRYGVAFSLEPGRNLPKIDVLASKIPLFNEYLRRHPYRFSDMWMWYWEGDKRGENYKPHPIPDDLITEGKFIFLGKEQPIDQLDYNLILDDFDRLLPLYKYVESGKESSTAHSRIGIGKKFRKASRSSLTEEGYYRESPKRYLYILRRHNELSNRFASWLEQAGFTEVTKERDFVDIAFDSGNVHYVAELKTCYGIDSTKAIREALGQLLEYNYYPGRNQADHWVIVLDKPAREEDVTYIKTLRERVNLPLSLGWLKGNGFQFGAGLGLDALNF